MYELLQSNTEALGAFDFMVFILPISRMWPSRTRSAPHFGPPASLIRLPMIIVSSDCRIETLQLWECRADSAEDTTCASPHKFEDAEPHPESAKRTKSWSARSAAFTGFCLMGLACPYFIKGEQTVSAILPISLFDSNAIR